MKPSCNLDDQDSAREKAHHLQHLNSGLEYPDDLKILHVSLLENLHLMLNHACSVLLPQSGSGSWVVVEVMECGATDTCQWEPIRRQCDTVGNSTVSIEGDEDQDAVVLMIATITDVCGSGH